jgi:apolipoprotein N-acyltransferase
VRLPRQTADATSTQRQLHQKMLAVTDTIESGHAGSRPSLLTSARFVLLPLATAVMLTLAFPPTNYKFLAWFALVPVGMAMRDKSHCAETYLGLYVGGLVFQLTTLDWLRSGHDATWLSGPRATQWLAQGVGLALIWPLSMFVARPFITRVSMPMAFALPIVWIAFEFSRRHLWVIVDTVGYVFGQLGLTQTANPYLIQVADLGGVYAVSALVASANGLIVDMISWVHARSRRKVAPFPLATIASVSLIGTAVWLYGVWRLSQPLPPSGPVIALMPRGSLWSLHITGWPKRENSGIIAEAPSAIVPQWSNTELPHLLIWSEVSCGIIGPNEPVNAQLRTQTTINRIEQFAQLANAALVIGCTRANGNRGATLNSAVVVGPDRFVGYYDKLRLVPFSEYQPPGRKWFEVTDMYAAGTSYPVFKVRCGSPSRECRLAVSICYDTCFPDLYREYMWRLSDHDIPQFFVVPAFEDFDHAMRLQDNLLQLARFRAIECRRAFVRNAHQGYSGIIDGNGALIEAPPEIGFDKPAVLGPIPLDERFSLYSVIGDWPAAICVGIVLAPILLSVIVRHPHSPIGRPMPPGIS